MRLLCRGRMPRVNMTYEILQTVGRIGIPKKDILRVIALVLRSIGESDASLSAMFIGDWKMRRLNHEWRGKDRTTDVLSFSQREGKTSFPCTTELGDVFICVPQVKRQAKERGIPYREECFRMLIHGILHLAGYDHVRRADAAVMLPLQESILATCLSV